MTTNENVLADLDKLRNHRARVEYAIGQLDMEPHEVKPEHVQAWFAERGHKLGQKSQRPAVSGHVNAWRKDNGLNTGAIRALTPGTLAEMDKERGFVGTPQETPQAGGEGSYNLDRVTVADFEPSPNAPQSPAVSTPPAVSPRPVTSSLPPVMSDPQRVTPSVPVATETTAAPAPAGRDATETPEDMTPNPSRDASHSDQDASDRPSWRARAWAWLVAKFVWIQYVGLLQVAAFGLFQVLRDGAGMPLPTAIGGAAAIELVGISLKILADGAERKGESHRVVRVLLVISGAIAVGIGAINAIGHAQMPAEGEGNPIIAAALFGTASIAGYSLWTVSSTLGHRARMRYLGQLEGPGLRIPAYITDRYGKEIADRAQKLSRFNGRLSVAAAVEQAKAELDAEERERRETERRNALRAGLIAHAKATHDDQLAADMESSRFGADVLADRFTATVEEHDAKVRELLDWMSSHKK